MTDGASATAEQQALDRVVEALRARKVGHARGRFTDATVRESFRCWWSGWYGRS